VLLLRLAHLVVTNALAMLSLLSMSDRAKDAEILALRHQLAILERQLHGQRPQFAPADRAFLAALLHRLPRDVLRRIRLIVRPETVLRWHRNLLARRHAAISRPKRTGRPPTVRSIRTLVLRLARENNSWGYRRIHGELLTLGIKVAASTVWQILKDAGIDPAPERTTDSWASFLRSQAEAILAADFFETVTLTGARLYVLAVIEHATRRIRILGITTHPTADWVTQAARNLVMDLQDAGANVRYLIRDRDGKYPTLFDTILADTGIRSVLTGVQMPRMNSIMERWIQSCRRELLDRMLIYNQAHLLRALREYEYQLQHAQAPPGHRQRKAPATVTRSDHRTRPDHPTRRPPTRPPRRHPPRVQTGRLTCVDGVSGTRNARRQRLAHGRRGPGQHSTQHAQCSNIATHPIGGEAMTITTLSSREFNQDTGRAKNAARSGPVFITDRGRPAHVLLTFEDYQRLTSGQDNIIDLLGLAPDEADIELETPHPRNPARPADLS
jgi:putative transposase